MHAGRSIDHDGHLCINQQRAGPREHIAADRKEAVALGINAGIDMIMDPYDPEVCKDIIASKVPDVKRLRQFRIACGSESMMIDCTETKVWDTPDID